MVLVVLSHIQICMLPHACKNANIFATFIKKVSIIGTEEKIRRNGGTGKSGNRYITYGKT